MEKELELWRFAAERLRRDETVMLLVVARSQGSSPGRPGFKMAVATGEMCGSIGGGVMEVRLVEQAKKILGAAGKAENPALRARRSAVVRQVHQKNSPDTSGMICSGRQTVIFFRLDAEHLEVVRKIVCALENRQAKKLLISNSEVRITDNESGDFDFRFEQSGENEFSYEEQLGFKNRLYIVGGGHCALALSEIASKMDFHISLFDDRADLNTLAKNRFVHEKKIIESYEKIGDFIPPSPNAYVVVMTLGYKSDETVIRKLIDKDFKYFGVLGSRAKMKTLLKNLEKENFPKERLARLRTPIGLKINSRTPVEIAVSIAAEIVSVKNAG